MPRVLVADDDADLRSSLRLLLEGSGWEVEEAEDGAAAVRAVQERAPNVVLLDLVMPEKEGQEALEEMRFLEPDLPVVILSGQADVDRAVRAMKAGARDFLTKPPDPDHLLLVLERAMERRALKNELDRVRSREEERFIMIGGEAPVMKEFLDMLGRVASTDSTVLLTGESGTGKELVARHLWKNGPRRDRPFVVVNCAALSETLLESDFFGHAKGAFTGATSAKPGRLEEADSGTLFLDEVCELPMAIQAKLLRVMEYGTFERVGETTTRQIDVRLVAATNRDPAGEIAEGRFREDLYHRLSVVALHLPPLRDRLEDLPRIVEHHLRLLATELGRPIASVDDDVLDRMRAYDWPGNVREVRNTLERAVVLSPEGKVSPDDIPVPSTGEGPDGGGPVAAVTTGITLTEGIDRFKRSLVEQTLAACGGNQTKAAEMLGMHRSSLNRLMKELGLR